jgi:uncharacterized protein YifN (PemK superfamily)
MLRSLKDLEEYAVSATDGDIGSVANFLLDDRRWTVRYLVVETGGFLGGRRVLISPISFRQVDWSTRRFHLELTRNRIKNSPSVDTDKPVSRQHESDYLGYYAYPYYWNQTPGEPLEKSSDVHLRSAREVRGYHIEGTDAAIGHVDDFIIDDRTWEVRYLVVDTRNWWLDKKVLVAPRWASRVSWEEQKVFVDLSREAIKSSPIWDAGAPINREYEARLYDYYGRPVYWESNDPAVRAASSTPHAAGRAG